MMKCKRFCVCSLLWSVLSLIAVLFFLDIGQTAQPSKGCTSCHTSLAEKLPKGHPQVPQGNMQGCLSCHSGKGRASSLEWSVHFRHFSADKFAGACGSCHETGQDGNFRLTGTQREEIKVGREMAEKMLPFFKSWAKSDLLDHGHAQKMVSCGDCHGSFFPEERASEEQCIKCHKSYQSLSETTKKVKPNPHDSHLGEIRCTLCHKAHEKSVNYCNQCHTFDFNFSKKK